MTLRYKFGMLLISNNLNIKFILHLLGGVTLWPNLSLASIIKIHFYFIKRYSIVIIIYPNSHVQNQITLDIWNLVVVLSTFKFIVWILILGSILAIIINRITLSRDIDFYLNLFDRNINPIITEDSNTLSNSVSLSMLLLTQL